jgi:parallel beta-helix repeat protein
VPDVLLATPAVIPAGVGYAVDSLNGNDANPGTPDRPFKTLLRLASVTLAAGEGIYLRCGSVWRESLTLTSKQLVNGSVLRAYGDNCDVARPRITAADDFSGGWTKTGNVWSRKVSPGTPKITRMFVNGLAVRLAQWPNDDVGNPALLAGATRSSLVVGPGDRSFLADRDLIGATVQIRSVDWELEARAITGFDAATGAMALAEATTYESAAGRGYVLQGKPWMIDMPGEFLHDTGNNVLYVYPVAGAAQGNLNGALVEGSTRDTGLTVRDRMDLRIADITVDMGRTDGIVLQNAAGAQVERIVSARNGRAGIRLEPGTQVASQRTTIRGSLLDENWVFGIDSERVADVDVVANRVSNTGTIASAANSRAGVWSGPGALIDGNEIRGSAYIGIRFSGSGGTRVLRNTVTDYCRRLSDCAGIYTWNGFDVSKDQMSLVDGNRVLGARPASAGTIGGGGRLVMGIYLDDLTRNATVRNNVIFDVPWGIYIHNASSSKIEGNRVWMTSEASIEAKMDRTGADSMTGNVFRNNQLVPAASVPAGTYPQQPTMPESWQASHAIRFSTVSGNGFDSLTPGSNLFAGNRLLQIQGIGQPMAAVRSGSSLTTLTVLSAQGWKSINPGEFVPRSPWTFATLRYDLGPELMSGGGFDTGIDGGWTTGGGKASAATGLPGCIGTCARFIASSPTDSLSSPALTIDAGASYLVRHDTGFTGDATIGTPYIGQTTSPYGSMADSRGLTVVSGLSGTTGESISFEAAFSAARSGPARVHLKVLTPGVGVAFDNVSLREVKGYRVASHRDWAALAMAPIEAARTVNCTTLGWNDGCAVADIDGSEVDMPITVPAGGVRLLLRTDSPFLR